VNDSILSCGKELSYDNKVLLFSEVMQPPLFPAFPHPVAPLRKYLTLLLAGVLLAACTKVPLGSLWALRHFDMERFNPAELRVALQLPSGLALHGNTLPVTVKVTRQHTNEQFTEVLQLREVKASSAGLPASLAGSRWMTLQLGEHDVERLQQFRQTLMASRSGKGKSTLELGAEPKLCRLAGAPAGAMQASVAIRWAAEHGFVMLFKDEDLAEVMASMQQPVEAISPCTQAPAM
jgi:hypothetical protein